MWTYRFIVTQIDFAIKMNIFPISHDDGGGVFLFKIGRENALFVRQNGVDKTTFTTSSTAMMTKILGWLRGRLVTQVCNENPNLISPNPPLHWRLLNVFLRLGLSSIDRGLIG